MEYLKLITENRNPESMRLDEMSSLEIAGLMNRFDADIPAAVEKTLPKIAETAERIAEAFRNGGRLIYAGAGTSGRHRDRHLRGAGGRIPGGKGFDVKVKEGQTVSRGESVMEADLEAIRASGYETMVITVLLA